MLWFEVAAFERAESASNNGTTDQQAQSSHREARLPPCHLGHLSDETYQSHHESQEAVLRTTCRDNINR